jgi:hypothetical protein
MSDAISRPIRRPKPKTDEHEKVTPKKEPEAPEAPTALENQLKASVGEKVEESEALYTRKPPKMAKAFEFILTKVYEFDQPIEEVYKRLEQELTIGQKRGDRGTLLISLDNAETNALTAHKLFLHALVEQETFRINVLRINAALRTKANAALQLQKDRGERSKMITDADMEHWIAEHYADEYLAQRRKGIQVDGMTESCKKLSERWEGRCIGLQTMLKTLRG